MNDRVDDADISQSKLSHQLEYSLFIPKMERQRKYCKIISES